MTLYLNLEERGGKACVIQTVVSDFMDEENNFKVKLKIYTFFFTVSVIYLIKHAF